MNYLSTINRAIKRFKFRAYQVPFVKHQSRRRIVLKARQLGYTYICTFEAIVEALALGRDQLFSSASERQAKLFISYAKKFLDSHFDIEPVHASSEKIVLPNQAALIALPKNFETIQGFGGSVYFDEFAWNSRAKDIWRVLVPSVSQSRGRITVLSTPYCKSGKFWDLWTTNNIYKKFKIDIYDAITNGLPIGEFEDMISNTYSRKEAEKAYIQSLKDDLDEPEFFPSAYECLFMDAIESYIPLSLIEAQQILLPEENTQAPIWLGIDIGRKKDNTEICALSEENGKVYQKFNISLQNTPWREQLDIINRLIRSHRVQGGMIDCTGIGNMLSELIISSFPSIPFIGVHFTREIKERLSISVKTAIEQKWLFLLEERDLALQIASVQRVAKEKGFSYIVPPNPVHHGDKYWALALALAATGKAAHKLSPTINYLYY